MRVPRVHIACHLANGTTLQAPDAAANHLVRVLRLKVDAALIVFDGQGQGHHARIERIDKQGVWLRLGEPIIHHSESPLKITLVQGISRGERMDWTLQKATELGVSHICPVFTERSVVRLDAAQAEKKRLHWQQVVVSACEQSGRFQVPDVALPVSLRLWLQSTAPTRGEPTLRLLLDPEANESLSGVAKHAGPVQLLIGPEGGMDDVEIHAARAAGFIGVRLGPRILRTETAAVVALSVLQAQWGDLG